MESWRCQGMVPAGATGVKERGAGGANEWGVASFKECGAGGVKEWGAAGEMSPLKFAVIPKFCYFSFHF